MKLEGITNVEVIKDINHLYSTLKNSGIECRRFPGYPLTDDERIQKLYHYTSFESFEKIWKNRTFKGGNISELNDLFERHKNVTSGFSHIALVCAFEHLRLKYKQVSLSMGIDTFIEGCMSPLMWAYYAKGVNGVCIEVDFNRLKLTEEDYYGIVRYVEWPDRVITIPNNIRTIRDVHNFIKANRQTIFFTKDKSWSHENEFRIVTSKEFIDISDAITAVYVGSFESKVCLDVENLVCGEVPVKFFHLNKNSLPQTTDTFSYRQQITQVKNDPDNGINKLVDLAKAKFEENINNWDADLTIPVADLISGFNSKS